MGKPRKARHYPDEEYAKDALFRLAVAFQGSSDNLNAIRLFQQFVMRFPDDKLVADAYLSLGDLTISEVNPDEQPSFDQIKEARKNYALVRKVPRTSVWFRTTFNEGGLLERVADNPEGLVEHYYTFDKNKDETLQQKEFDASGLFQDISFGDYDLNQDKGLDYGELFELASLTTYAEIEKVFGLTTKNTLPPKERGVSQATSKIGFCV